MDKLFNHVIRRNQHIVLHAAVHFGQHGFVGIKRIVHHMDIGVLLLKLCQNIFIDVVAPVIDTERDLVAALPAAACDGKQHEKRKSQGADLP